MDKTIRKRRKIFKYLDTNPKGGLEKKEGVIEMYRNVNAASRYCNGWHVSLRGIYSCGENKSVHKIHLLK